MMIFDHREKKEIPKKPFVVAAESFFADLYIWRSGGGSGRCRPTSMSDGVLRCAGYRYPKRTLSSFLAGWAVHPPARQSFHAILNGKYHRFVWLQRDQLMDSSVISGCF